MQDSWHYITGVTQVLGKPEGEVKTAGLTHAPQNVLEESRQSLQSGWQAKVS